MKNNKKLKIILVILAIILDLIAVFLFKEMEELIISMILLVTSIILILGLFFIISEEERELEKIEINDERNIMIRNKSQATSNTIMVFAQVIIAIIMISLKYYWVAILIATLVVLNGIVICVVGAYYNKQL